ncbi:MAG: hypothetical protein GX562_06985, partial [Coriobacteriaceae bacterium]|nr:hypothetical protein [Coriobacteriaceae bacterium]
MPAFPVHESKPRIISLRTAQIEPVASEERDIMLRIPDSRLDMLIAEDVPYIDLTSVALDITQEMGEMEYFTREDCLLCCTEEVARMMSRLDVTVTESKPSGSRIAANETFLVAQGSAGALHMAWKVCLNMFDHYSAV